MNEQIAPVIQGLASTVLGADDRVELLVIGLLAEGHVLIEGPPGCGKTTLARTLARCVDCTFRRVQFTPDLLPADLVGFTVYNQQSRAFDFHAGAVFGHIVLADEINRAGPRVQSALLECMNERQVTVDGRTYALERPFIVVATQNHTESSGTFPLPDSQLDRFLLSFEMTLPSPPLQTAILALHADAETPLPTGTGLSHDALLALINAVQTVAIDPLIRDYIVALCEQVRGHPELYGTVSTRTAIGIMRAARACAFLRDDPAVYPDHVKAVAPYALRHRVSIRGARRNETAQRTALLQEILNSTPVPL